MIQGLVFGGGREGGSDAPGVSSMVLILNAVINDLLPGDQGQSE
jgi:hypothetical protein